MNLPASTTMNCCYNVMITCFSGIPNALNVISNFPFLIVGIVGLVLCYYGNYFKLRYRDSCFLICFRRFFFGNFWLLEIPPISWFSKSLPGELFGWTFFFAGVGAVALGSSYYHLKPNDARLVCDRLPVCFL